MVLRELCSSIDGSVTENMGNNHIKVYARIKRENNVNKSGYEIIAEEDFDTLKIYDNGSTFKRKRLTFRFNKVFSANARQNEIFDEIAKPIINNVFSGLNATVFAYGATGSGKTYTLTGSQNKFEERGLIPRTIEYIFELVSHNMSNYMFFISYLEIYNEKAYDLLNPKQNFTCLEELPRVVVLEDERGEAHFKNLCLKEVNTEREAMRWLYFGDNNRTIAETPLNDYSSRSHCVFTVHVITKCHKTGNITRSKLNLVDLAGSERLHRMNLQGMTLNEARHINLSLHYLERVIQALSQRGKNHVPYRNSMMTFILRDSLGGNCLTAMLATLSLLSLNLEETISTCKFSQRVCLIKLDASVNLISNPEKEITHLRSELKRLKRELNEKHKERHRKLTRQEEDECKFSVRKYLEGIEDLKVSDPRKVRFYLECLRDKLFKQNVQPITPSNDRNLNCLEKKYQQIMKQKDEEINMLMNIYELSMDTKGLFKPTNSESLFSSIELSSLERSSFKEFLIKNQLKNRYDLYVEKMKLRYRDAIKVSQSLGETQRQIINLKKLINRSENRMKPSGEDLSKKLLLDQAFYREQLVKMHNIKNDIDNIKDEMSKLKLKIMREFKHWLSQNRVLLNTSPNFKDYIISDKKFDQPSNNPIFNKASSIISLSRDNYPSSIIESPVKIATHTFESSNFDSNNDWLESQKCIKDLYPQRNNIYCSFAAQVSNNHGNLHLLSTINESEFQNEEGCQTNFDDVPTLLEPQNSGKENKKFSLTNLSNVTVGNIGTLPHLHSSEYKIGNNCIFQNGEPFCRTPLSSSALNSQNYHTSCCDYLQSIKKISPSTLSCKIGSSRNLAYKSQENSNKTLSLPPVRKFSFKFIKPEDSPQFISYLKAIPLTGDDDVDEEIVKFYRLKYARHELN